MAKEQKGILVNDFGREGLRALIQGCVTSDSVMGESLLVVLERGGPSGARD